MLTDLFLSVVGISISVSLIVLALVLTAPLLNRRYAVKWKYFIWIFLALRLLIPFSGNEIRAIVDGKIRYHAFGNKKLAVVVPNKVSVPAGYGAAATEDSFSLRWTVLISQCGHGKCAPSFLSDFRHRKSRIPVKRLSA